MKLNLGIHLSVPNNLIKKKIGNSLQLILIHSNYLQIIVIQSFEFLTILDNSCECLLNLCN